MTIHGARNTTGVECPNNTTGGTDPGKGHVPQMTLSTLVALCAIVGVPLGVSGLLFTARQQKLTIAAAARQADKERRDEIAAAVAAAVAPIEKDRDYYRDRADAFETELRRNRAQ